MVDKEDKQIYKKMHTADWWWTTQQALIDSDTQNASVIPVLLAIDKTVLTEHIEEIVQWLVYLTICNLSHEI